MNKRFVNIFTLCSFITFVSLTAIFITLARLEYNKNIAIYNVSHIIATSYDAALLVCGYNNSPKPYTGIINGEYYAWNSNHTKNLYQKKLVVDNICGINVNDTILNAKIKWPIGTTRTTNYLISDPNILEPYVPHGELHLFGAISMGILAILVVIIYIFWYRRKQDSWYQLQHV